MFDVVAIGEMLVDFTQERNNADGYPIVAAHPGGAVANYLAPLAKYGLSTALIAKVGNDAFGRLLSTSLQSAGINSKFVSRTSSAFTTLAFDTRDEYGEREFSFVRKPGADTLLELGDIDFSVLNQSRVLHFGSVCMTDEPSRSTHYSVVNYAKKAGLLISYDPNLRESLWQNLEEARDQILWGLSQADIIKISDSELEFLYGLSPKDGATQIFSDFSPKLVFVTCGKHGCYFKSLRADGHVPSLKGLSVVDTTGAGDIFGGSAMYAILQSGKQLELLNEDDLLYITTFACTSASLSTTKLGGLSSVPTMDEVFTKMN